MVNTLIIEISDIRRNIIRSNMRYFGTPHTKPCLYALSGALRHGLILSSYFILSL